MAISDLISFIGIILAIIAFINENERLFILNKFDAFDKVIVVLYFLLVNFLLFYYWWNTIIPSFDIFENNSFPLPKNWAYIITILFIIWVLYKIFYSSFPDKNNQNRLSYYKSLLQRKEYVQFYSLLEKYDKNNLLNNTETTYLQELIHYIFTNKDFLKETSTYNYDFFIRILANCKNNNVYSYSFIESQINNPNSLIYDKVNDNTIFYKLLNNNENIHNIIYNCTISDNKIIDLAFELTHNNSSYLYGTILEMIICRNKSEILHIFFIKYFAHIKKFNNTQIKNSFNPILETLVSNSEVITGKNISKFIDIIIFICNKDKEYLNEKFVALFKVQKANKVFIKLVYDEFFNKNYQSKEFESILNEIYN